MPDPQVVITGRVMSTKAAENSAPSSSVGFMVPSSA